MALAWEDLDDQDAEDLWWAALAAEPLDAGLGILERAAAARPSWEKRAACRGLPVEMFFPGPGDAAGEARAVCGACPVREPCGRYAASNSERFGIWGGLSKSDRRALRWSG